jgi:diguanylate cyclase (GGDEF)-like protein
MSALATHFLPGAIPRLKRWSLKWRILALALFPATFIAVVLTIAFVDSLTRGSEVELRERGQMLARQLAPAAEYGLILRDQKALQDLVNSIGKGPDVVSVTISDAAGHILATSGDPKIGPLRPPADESIAVTERNGFMTFTAPVHEITRRDNSLSRESLLGWSTVSLSKSAIADRGNELIWRSLLISVAALAGAAMLAVVMSRRIRRPLHQLVNVVERIGRGNLDIKADTDAIGEIGELASGVNVMTATLKMAQKTLQEKVDLATEQLTYQASHDTLTGLINRREFEARLDRAVTSAQENGANHALCFLDLDQFKVVNDSCGHEAGDQLLRQLGHHLKGNLRDRDTLARLGGDEFGLLLENCSLENAMEVAAELLASVQGFHFSWQGKSFVIGCSIGLVPVTSSAESMASVLSHADAACYVAKDLGRNRVQVYQPPGEKGEARPAGASWLIRINQSLMERRFRLVYQPIVPVGAEQAGQPRYYEALLRMVRENGDVVLPMAFIPAAERYNLMPTIDRWVVEAAFADYRRLMDAGRAMNDCVFSINLSGSSLCDEKFASFLEYQFANYEVPPHKICFEITETAAVTNLTQALRLMQDQKQVGCRFMLDDFGSGLSSFTYLKNLPVDGIKIDGAFVKDMVVNGMDAAMVEAINNIGHVMGLSTVAEYVEDQAIMDKLREFKVDYAQGNAVQRPLPLEECFDIPVL